MIKNNLKLIYIVFALAIVCKNTTSQELLSYQSLYTIKLDNNRDSTPSIGKSYITDAQGELFLDWFDNCKSWVSNQRMFVKFRNSNNVGTISDINFSLKESYESSELEFALQVKENNLLVERINGKGKKDKKVNINISRPAEKKIELPIDVMFPHEHLKFILTKLGSSETMFSKKVYEGSIPNNFLNISTFINESKSTLAKELLTDDVLNEFYTVRMAYYEDKASVASLELTAKINKQGLVSYFKYDYPDYSLIMNLKKLTINKKNCN